MNVNVDRLMPHTVMGAMGLLLALLGTSANANLILNGSFETPSPLDPCNPSVCSGSFRNFSAGSSFDGWSVIGGGEMSLGSTDFSQFGFNFPAADGQQWADLSGFGSNSTVGISQAVTTLSGQRYDLSFSLGNVVDTSVGLFGNSSTIEILLNGASLGLFTNTAGDTTTSWQRFSISFLADSALSTIAFFNRDGSDDNMNGLDDVVLDARGIAVAEPGSLGLLGAGLAGIAMVARRRRKR